MLVTGPSTAVQSAPGSKGESIKQNREGQDVVHVRFQALGETPYIAIGRCMMSLALWAYHLPLSNILCN